MLDHLSTKTVHTDYSFLQKKNAKFLKNLCLRAHDVKKYYLSSLDIFFCVKCDSGMSEMYTQSAKRQSHPWIF